MMLASGAVASAALAGVTGASPSYTAEGTSTFGPLAPDVLFVVLAIYLVIRSRSSVAVKWIVAAWLAGTVAVVATNGVNNYGYLIGNSSGYLIGTVALGVVAVALTVVIEIRRRSSQRSRAPQLG